MFLLSNVVSFWNGHSFIFWGGVVLILSWLKFSQFCRWFGGLTVFMTYPGCHMMHPSIMSTKISNALGSYGSFEGFLNPYITGQHRSQYTATNQGPNRWLLTCPFGHRGNVQDFVWPITTRTGCYSFCALLWYFFTSRKTLRIITPGKKVVMFGTDQSTYPTGFRGARTGVQPRSNVPPGPLYWG